ncbi:MAG: GxxExxY protein [Patescibacteria group bacterium]|mgnify:CR=1 FL=1
MITDETDKLLYEELTFKIIGALFKVHNLLGNSLEEKYYQRALAKEFEILGLRFKREQQVKLEYEGADIGDRYLDFVIGDKVILETKTIPQITNKSLTQLISYLKSTKLRIGILANFRSERLSYRRVVNPLIR